ncbi:MAG TPA: glycogen/starch synthase [Pelolinea sp.]|nr:glycogen/starch synthase [Pelolinea sp.]
MAGHQTNPLRVLFLTAEYEPFAKVGGLGDYSGSLPKAIGKLVTSRERPVDIRVAVPLHGLFDRKSQNLKKVANIAVPKPHSFSRGSAFEFHHQDVPIYLINRAGNASGYSAIYNPSQIHDARKYVFFSLACADLVKKINWSPDIIHANDWHTALAIYQFSNLRKVDPFYKRSHTLQVIHNMPYLGQGSETILNKFGISPVLTDIMPVWARNLPLPMGLISADKISTVSPSYSDELKEEEFSDGLAGFFIQNSSKTTGILNGIDTDIWNPETDHELVSNFSSESIAKRRINKKSVLREFGLDDGIDKPLLVLISRLTHQKGIDILLQGLPRILDQEWNAIFLGTGQVEYEAAFRTFETLNPDRFKIILQFNNSLAHRLYSAGDILLMPSLYEPCGLSQMIAMRYGCIPVARSVGGLKDSIISDSGPNKTGYLFSDADEVTFTECLRNALLDFTNRKNWESIQKRAMKQDFSWNTSAKKYIELYEEIISSDK